MLKLSLLIWFALIGYKAYDLYTVKVHQEKIREEKRNEKQSVKKEVPKFNSKWEGYTIKKNKVSSTRLMSKAKSTKDKAK